ncbi:DNA-binding MarR family transcriptional regulator [Microbacterium resistens]|uniref:DNA-binding MarR family transcriptional regulator n=1 Tax=Microbacterium resistens TaxID=156977 RepID=A0ABU1S8B2_9MICO|nr:MarR family transcriptional regulator [Microbacterium resistens]MDR6865851.1 DNA-binding MarR family transcriptional regulator [Microbacterium resistens]
MNSGETIQSIVFSAHALTRIAAHTTGNETPAAQWRALSLLASDGPLRIGELARASRTTQPGMTRLIGQLEQEGLVRRSSDPEDSRATVVSVTDDGRAAILAWRHELQQALEPRFADLSPDDWAILARAAEILRTRTISERTTR